MQSATFLTRSFFDASHIAPFPDLACFHRFELFLQIQARPLNETGTPLDGVAYRRRPSAYSIYLCRKLSTLSRCRVNWKLIGDDFRAHGIAVVSIAPNLTVPVNATRLGHAMIDGRDKENRFPNAITKVECVDASKLTVIEKKLLALPKLFESPNCQYGFSAVGRRWENEGGSDRDEREIESREDTLGRQLRYR